VSLAKRDDRGTSPARAARSKCLPWWDACRGPRQAHCRIVGNFPVQRYRQIQLTSIWILAFGAFPLLSGLVGAVYIAGPWQHGAHRLATCLCLGWAVIGLAAGCRSALVSVVATPDELIIRNFFTTRRIRWAEVQAITRPRDWVEPSRGSAFVNSRNGLHIRRTDGRVELATAFTSAKWDGRRLPTP
jgi:hypothetical protein